MKPFIIHPSPASRQDAKALEQRRFKAGKLFAKGIPQVKVARRFKVSRAAVHYWYTTWQRNGQEALTRRRPGPRPRLTVTQAAQLKRLLLKGAQAAGYDTALWTLARIADTLKKQFRIRYQPTQVWYIMRALGWSNQKPETRYRDRNEAAIKRWKSTQWPAIQKRGSI